MVQVPTAIAEVVEQIVGVRDVNVTGRLLVEVAEIANVLPT